MSSAAKALPSAPAQAALPEAEPRVGAGVSEPDAPALVRTDSSDESDSSEESDIDSEASSALFMAVRPSPAGGVGWGGGGCALCLHSVFTHISNPEIQRKRKRPPRGSGSRRAAAPGATAGPAHPAPRAAARPPLCGRPPASWSRVSGLLTSVLVLPTGHQGLRHLCPWSGHRPGWGPPHGSSLPV